MAGRPVDSFIGELEFGAPKIDEEAFAATLALGPAVGTTEAGGVILDALLPHAGDAPVIIDAAAVCAGIDRQEAIAALPASTAAASISGVPLDRMAVARPWARSASSTGAASG